MKLFDWAALALGAVLTAGSAWWVYAGIGKKDRIFIQGPEGARWIYPLDAQELVRVPGPLGDTVVEIRDGGARILSSPCANQTCVAGGTVRRHGQWLACLPNNVLVSVDGAETETAVDAAVW